jgi:hypothetical protein
MHPLRRLLFSASPARASGWRNTKVLALLLVIVVPGGIALPIVYGIYGALRHTFTPKTHNRSASAQVDDAAIITAPLDPESRT